MPEEEKIQRITALLEKGGTMLASHHECGAPMFRYQGKIVCPVCDFQEEKEVTKEIKKELKREQVRQIKPVQKPTEDYRAISRVIRDKIIEISTSLETESDLQRVKDKMECIERGIRILKLLQES